MRNISMSLLVVSLAACGTISSKGTTDTDTDIDTAFDTDTDADTDDTDADTDDTDVAAALAWNEDAWTTDWTDFIDCSDTSKAKLEIEANGEGVAAFFLMETREGQTSPWSEYHTLDQGTAGAGFAPFSRELTTGATVAAQTSDVSTLFKCDDSGASIDPDELGSNFKAGFYVGLWSAESAALLGDTDSSNDPASPDDCVAFGHNVALGFTDTTLSSAAARPSWVTTANCRVLP